MTTTTQSASPVAKVLSWQPRLILAGASFRDRLVACAGALLGIFAVAAISTLLAHPAQHHLLIVGSMGASAVLLFAIPASPLSQPWPIIGGNVVSALSGVAAYQFVPNFWLACGVAVALAMLLMSLLRCLHPPGGGTALIAVVGGSAVHVDGFLFAFWPVAINATLLVLSGWLFHRISGHSYPHRVSAPSGSVESRFRSEDIDSALAELGETLDVDRGDLEVLFGLAEQHARRRRG